jgi:hypothetical protein
VVQRAVAVVEHDLLDSNKHEHVAEVDPQWRHWLVDSRARTQAQIRDHRACRQTDADHVERPHLVAAQHHHSMHQAFVLQ